jgi:hypothetical protein
MYTEARGERRGTANRAGLWPLAGRRVDPSSAIGVASTDGIITPQDRCCLRACHAWRSNTKASRGISFLPVAERPIVGAWKIATLPCSRRTTGTYARLVGRVRVRQLSPIWGVPRLVA